MSFELELVYRVHLTVLYMEKFLYLSSALNLKGLYFAESAYVVFLLELFILEHSHYFDPLLPQGRGSAKSTASIFVMSDARLAGIILTTKTIDLITCDTFQCLPQVYVLYKAYEVCLERVVKPLVLVYYLITYTNLLMGGCWGKYIIWKRPGNQMFGD